MTCHEGTCVPAGLLDAGLTELAPEDYYTNLMVVTGDKLVWGLPSFPFTLNSVSLAGGTPIELVSLARGPVGLARRSDADLLDQLRRGRRRDD